MITWPIRLKWTFHCFQKFQHSFETLAFWIKLSFLNNSWRTDCHYYGKRKIILFEEKWFTQNSQIRSPHYLIFLQISISFSALVERVSHLNSLCTYCIPVRDDCPIYRNLLNLTVRAIILYHLHNSLYIYPV